MRIDLVKNRINAFYDLVKDALEMERLSLTHEIALDKMPWACLFDERDSIFKVLEKEVAGWLTLERRLHSEKNYKSLKFYSPLTSALYYFVREVKKNSENGKPFGDQNGLLDLWGSAIEYKDLMNRVLFTWEQALSGDEKRDDLEAIHETLEEISHTLISR